MTMAEMVLRLSDGTYTMPSGDFLHSTLISLAKRCRTAGDKLAAACGTVNGCQCNTYSARLLAFPHAELHSIHAP